MKHVILFISLFIVLSPVRAESDPEALFEAGNEAYQQGAYDSALALYSRIDSSGTASGAVYYNMGNAYYKNGNIPRAVLYYERAKRLMPGNEDVQHNLEFVNQRTVDDITPLPTLLFEEQWDQWRSSMSLDSRLVLTVVLFWLFTGFLVLIITNFGGLRQISFYIAIALGFFFLLTGVTSVLQYQHLNDRSEAVVMNSVVKVKSEPSKSAKTLFVIHSGLKVSIRSKVDDQLEITLPDGRVGWIHQDDIERI